MQHLSSLSSIVNRYDALILDLWGVVHDGVELYPEALDTLAQLKQAGKRVIFLSNAPRRAAVAVAKLDSLGVDSALYERVLTSGEAAFDYLSQPQQQAQWGRRCYFLGLEMDEPLLEDLSFAYERVGELEQAEFILNAGYETLTQPPEALLPRMQYAQERHLPMLCINPDIIVVRQSGERILCAGHLAQLYEEMGGAVTYIGKPYPLVYAQCAAHFSGVPKDRMLAVGDSLSTDIKGANTAGIDSVLVTGGILQEQLAEGGGALEALCEEYGVTPEYVVPKFVW